MGGPHNYAPPRPSPDFPSQPPSNHLPAHHALRQKNRGGGGVSEVDQRGLGGMLGLGVEEDVPAVIHELEVLDHGVLPSNVTGAGWATEEGGHVEIGE